MQTCVIHIVALPYYEVGACLGDFLAEAAGRALTLRPEPTNEVDARAVRAYDWQGRHVGYVASVDLPQTWRALHGSGLHSLRGSGGSCDVVHKCLEFHCTVDTLGVEEELYPSESYRQWTYTGPVLKPTQEMVTLEYMTDEIMDRLDEREGWREGDREDFVLLVKRFCGLSRYDLSGEMDAYRRRLCLRLMAAGDAGLAPLVDELTLAFGRTGRELHEGEVLDYWLRVLADKRTVRSLLTDRRTYDVGMVRSQLEKFPSAMFMEWRDDRKRFVRKLLYMHIPRQVLWQFISGIAFVELEESSQRGQRESDKAVAMSCRDERGGTVVYNHFDSSVETVTIQGSS